MKLNTLGFDNEFFLEDEVGSYVLASTITSGTKEAPQVLEGGITIQADGVAIEVGTTAGAPTIRRWNNMCSEAMGQLEDFVARNALHLSGRIVGTFTEEQLEGDDGELGCSGDYDAWKKAKNAKVEREEAGNTRCVGRHLHIGVTNNDDSKLSSDECCRLIKAMDLLHGSGGAGSRHAERSRLYGKAGAHRPKSYGVEYRVPSINFLNAPNQIWNTVKDAISLCNSGELEELIELRGGEDVIKSTVNAGGDPLSSSTGRVHERHFGEFTRASHTSHASTSLPDEVESIVSVEHDFVRWLAVARGGTNG